MIAINLMVLLICRYISLSNSHKMGNFDFIISIGHHYQHQSNEILTLQAMQSTAYGKGGEG
jgi:hypothetical protein